VSETVVLSSTFVVDGKICNFRLGCGGSLRAV